MRWALGVRDAAKTSCHEAERIRHGQCKWRWVTVRGICASESLTLWNRYLPHVTYKERLGLSLPLHPLCSGEGAQRVPGDPKSAVPAQEGCLGFQKCCASLTSQGMAGMTRQDSSVSYREGCRLLWSKMQPREPATISAPQAVLCTEGRVVVQEDRNTSVTLQRLPARISVASPVQSLREIPALH